MDVVGRLGISVADLVPRLARGLLDGTPPANRKAGPRQRTSPSSSPAARPAKAHKVEAVVQGEFVGRRRELAYLRGWLMAAVEGQPRLVLWAASRSPSRSS